MNRSFWTAATSSGLVVNSPARKWFTGNDAETIFERLEEHGKTWKVYVMEPMSLSFTGIIHYPRLKDRLATHFVRFSEFEKDAAAGTLPDLSLIEPNMISGHGDYHPAFGRAYGPRLDIALDPPSSILSGEAFLERVFNAYRSATSPTGTNVWNTALLIGWDEPGGRGSEITWRRGRSRRPIRPRPRASSGSRSIDPATASPRSGLALGRAQLRVPDEEFRHTSLIATLRTMWNLGDPFTPRKASAGTFEHVFTRETPRNPEAWATFEARPVPAWTMDPELVGKAISVLGKAAAPGLIERARSLGLKLQSQLSTIRPSI